MLDKLHHRQMKGTIAETIGEDVAALQSELASVHDDITGVQEDISDAKDTIGAVGDEIAEARDGGLSLAARLGSITVALGGSKDLLIKDAVYSGGNIVLTIHSGKAKINDTFIIKDSDTTFTIPSPTAMTTYTIFIDKDGDFSFVADAALSEETDDTMLIGMIEVSSPASSFVLTDLRYVYSKGGGTSSPSLPNTNVIEFIQQSPAGSRGSTQTVFTVPAYLPGSNRLLVFRDGVFLALTTDYVETNASTVTFADSVPVDSHVTFLYLARNSIYNTGQVLVTATGAQTVDIDITDDGSFCVPAINVLKQQGSTWWEAVKYVDYDVEYYDPTKLKVHIKTAGSYCINFGTAVLVARSDWGSF